MAPSAITSTITEATVPAPELKLHSTLTSGAGDRGTYRLFAPKYNKEAELVGKDGHAGAKVYDTVSLSPFAQLAERLGPSWAGKY